MNGSDSSHSGDLARHNPYALLNDRLFHFMGASCTPLDRRRLDTILKDFDSLPQPKTDVERWQFQASKLEQTIPNLANRIGREAATARPRNGDSQRIALLWRQSHDLGIRFGERTWASFASACGKCGEEEVFLQVLGECTAKNPDLSERMWDLLAHVAGELALGEAVKRAWVGCETARRGFAEGTWAAFADAAGKCTDKEVLKEIWDVSQPFRERFQSHFWGASANAAAGCDDRALVGEMWRASAARREGFDGIAWASLAKAAGQCRDGKLLEDVWSESEARRTTFESGTWGSFAHAASECRDQELLKRVWTSAQDARGGFDGAAWGTFANAAGECGDGGLLKEVWTQSEPFRAAFRSGTWGSFAHAASECRDQELLKRVWTSAQDARGGFDGAAWGTFADSAGDFGDRELLTQVWEGCATVRHRLGHVAYGSMANAAGRCGNPELLSELLLAWNPQSDTLIKQEHQTWASFLSAALVSRREDIFLTVFRKFESLYDPTRLRNRGTLQTYLRNILHRIENAAIRKEVRDALYGISVDREYCLRLLSQKDTPAGQFGGAGRCLMRWLVNSWYWDDRATFDGKVSGLVKDIHSLGDDRCRAALFAMMTRGQSVFYGAIRESIIRLFSVCFR